MPKNSRPPCVILECTEPQKARGWCLKHYTRWTRHGDPLAILQTPSDDGLAWLRAAIETAGPECIDWPFAMKGAGYGAIQIGGKAGRAERAHRVALILATGEPPFPGAMALHSCDRPICVNPRHLRWGSAADNVADMWARERQGGQFEAVSS